MAEENAIEKVVKKSAIGRWLWTIATALTLPVIGFAGNAVLNQYHKTMETLDSVSDRLGELERDKANDDAIWASIADNKQMLVEMRIRHEAAMRHIEWVSQRTAWSGAKPDEIKKPPSSGVDQREVPPNDPLDPKIDPDKFRKDWEQQHPDMPKKK